MAKNIIKILIIISALMLSVCAAVVPDDDSVPYYPYPFQPQTEQPETKPAPQNSAPKKSSSRTRKKTSPKKTPAPKRKSSSSSSSRTSKRPAQVRKSSLQQGIELIQQDRYEQAKPYLLKAIQENRNDPNAWYWYGVYHEKTGGFYQAQYFYSKAVTIDPAFEPLSRVVFYPEDKEKTPLWDPKRPARVYPVETASVPLNVSRFPNAPNDPEIPKVPVYTPPNPNSSPLDGDDWNPAVYVPPSPEETDMFDGQSPVYTPPDAGAVVADENIIVRRAEPQIQRYDDYDSASDSGMIITERDKVLRADKPLYNPPEPGQKVAQAPKTPETPQPRQTVKIQTRQETSRRQASIPANRIVRQQKKSSQPKAAPKQPRQSKQSRRSRQTVSQDVKPVRQPQPQTQPQVRPDRPETSAPVQPPVRQPQPEPQPQRRQTEYMPPVGQYAPDPGTISETPIPPVGQGSHN